MVAVIIMIKTGLLSVISIDIWFPGKNRTTVSFRCLKMLLSEVGGRKGIRPKEVLAKPYGRHGVAAVHTRDSTLQEKPCEVSGRFTVMME